MDRNGQPIKVMDVDGPTSPGLGETTSATQKGQSRSRSRRRMVSYKQPLDGDENIDENTSAAELLRRRQANDPAAAERMTTAADSAHLSPIFVPLSQVASAQRQAQSDVSPTGALEPLSTVLPNSTHTFNPTITTTTSATSDPSQEVLILPGTNVTLDSPQATRPKADGVSFPFKLGQHVGINGHEDANASTMTLVSSVGVGAGTGEGAATPGFEQSLGSAALAPGTIDGVKGDGLLHDPRLLASHSDADATAIKATGSLAGNQTSGGGILAPGTAAAAALAVEGGEASDSALVAAEHGRPTFVRTETPGLQTPGAESLMSFGGAAFATPMATPASEGLQQRELQEMGGGEVGEKTPTQEKHSGGFFG